MSDESSKYLKQLWACGDCGDTYEDQDEAFNCCPPIQVYRYVCPECKTDWYTEEQAIECHEACEIKNHMAKLEAAVAEELLCAGALQILERQIAGSRGAILILQIHTKIHTPRSRGGYCQVRGAKQWLI